MTPEEADIFWNTVNRYPPWMAAHLRAQTAIASPLETANQILLAALAGHNRTPLRPQIAHHPRRQSSSPGTPQTGRRRIHHPPKKETSPALEKRHDIHPPSPPAAHRLEEPHTKETSRHHPTPAPRPTPFNVPIVAHAPHLQMDGIQQRRRHLDRQNISHPDLSDHSHSQRIPPRTRKPRAHFHPEMGRLSQH